MYEFLDKILLSCVWAVDLFERHEFRNGNTGALCMECGQMLGADLASMTRHIVLVHPQYAVKLLEKQLDLGSSGGKKQRKRKLPSTTSATMAKTSRKAPPKGVAAVLSVDSLFGPPAQLNMKTMQRQKKSMAGTKMPTKPEGDNVTLMPSANNNVPPLPLLVPKLDESNKSVLKGEVKKLAAKPLVKRANGGEEKDNSESRTEVLAANGGVQSPPKCFTTSVPQQTSSPPVLPEVGKSIGLGVKLDSAPKVVGSAGVTYRLLCVMNMPHKKQIRQVLVLHSPHEMSNECKAIVMLDPEMIMFRRIQLDELRAVLFAAKRNSVLVMWHHMTTIKLLEIGPEAKPYMAVAGEFLACNTVECMKMHLCDQRGLNLQKLLDCTVSVAREKRVGDPKLRVFFLSALIESGLDEASVLVNNRIEVINAVQFVQQFK
uniref:SPIN-DOC-like zinc-finger domain-containing protein n=1 Tax=Globodera rostochiensis TaxID=31243 RepID=A0A914GRX6_GLORO